MKRILLTTVVFIFVAYLKVNAQQEPQFTHYMFNKMVYNPAAAGFDKDYVTITGLYHNQWTDFKDPDGASAPVTQTASIDYTLPLQMKPGMHISIGAHFLNDKEAFFITTGFMFSGAFHMGSIGNLNLGGDLSIGFNAGMINKYVDGTHWRSSTPGDPLLPGTISNAGFDAGFGLMYHNPTWYAGISALHLPATQLDWTSVSGNGTTYNVDRTYFLTAGYYYDIKQNPDLELQPSILVKKDIAKTSLSFSTLFLYKQRYWGGLSIRTEELTAVALMLGMQIPLPKSQMIRIGYSYDLGTYTKDLSSTVPTPFGGTHEIFVSYRFKIDLKYETPVFDRTPRFL
jgi:type IX secretion system PorP/SprF family membrane protein